MASSIFHGRLLEVLYRIVQLSDAPAHTLLDFGANLGRQRTDGPLVYFFELLQFFLSGRSIVGRVDGLLLRFFGGYLELG